MIIIKFFINNYTKISFYNFIFHLNFNYFGSKVLNFFLARKIFQCSNFNLFRIRIFFSFKHFSGQKNAKLKNLKTYYEPNYNYNYN